MWESPGFPASATMVRSSPRGTEGLPAEREQTIRFQPQNESAEESDRQVQPFLRADFLLPRKRFLARRDHFEACLAQQARQRLRVPVCDVKRRAAADFRRRPLPAAA